MGKFDGQYAGYFRDYQSSVTRDGDDAVQWDLDRDGNSTQGYLANLPHPFALFWLDAGSASRDWTVQYTFDDPSGSPTWHDHDSGTLASGVSEVIFSGAVPGRAVRLTVASEPDAVAVAQSAIPFDLRGGPGSVPSPSRAEPARETVGTQQISVASTGSTDIDPANNGVSGSVCEAVVQNNGDVNVWVAPSGTGAAQGTELLPGDTLTEQGFKAGTHTEIHVPTSGSGDVDVRFREEV